MMNIKKILSIVIIGFVVTACSHRAGFDFNAISGSYYIDAIQDYDDSEYYDSNYHDSRYYDSFFGPYGVYGFGGGFRGPMEFYKKGDLPGEEIVGLWYVTLEGGKRKFYYVRSLPGQGVIADNRYFWSDWSYQAYISFGPMHLDEGGISILQKPAAQHVRTAPSGYKYYSWGKRDSLYYRVLRKKIDPEETPLDWIEVPGVNITQQQYDALSLRCNKPWWRVRCFMDEDFVGVTPKQLSYIKARHHPDDEDRLSGKVPMPKPAPPNPWL